MGTLKNDSTESLFILNPRTLVGRSHAAGLQLSNANVSGEHAVLVWRDGEWHLRDLASRNGTTLNGQKLSPGLLQKLSVGDSINFGQTTDWTLIDTSSPAARALRSDGLIVNEAEGFLCLPDQQNPEVTIYKRSDGRWTCEREGSVSLILSGEAVHVSEHRYVIDLPQESQLTHDLGPLRIEARSAALRLFVSADEEDVGLEVLLTTGWARVEPRAHFYLLLTLARERHLDAERGLPLSEQGWIHVDTLSQMLAAQRSLINMHVLRIRKTMQALGLRDAAQIIERRPHSKKIRLSTPRTKIIRAA